jgi:hypothetical protein
MHSSLQQQQQRWAWALGVCLGLLAAAGWGAAACWAVCGLGPALSCARRRAAPACTGTHHQWAKRLAGVGYASMSHPSQRAPSYQVLGVLLSLQLAISAGEGPARGGALPAALLAALGASGACGSRRLPCC